MSTPLMVITNLPNMAAAEAMAMAIVEREAGACVNIVPSVTSVYRWEGKIEKAQEVMLIVKTQYALYTQLEQLILSLHPYELPEIIGVPISAGLPAYLQWIAQQTKKEVHV
jgi:periplasmic divalent cation tolerance protein